MPPYLLPLLLVFGTKSVSAEPAGPGQAERSLEIDWLGDRFLKEGQEFRYYSGSMHYFRVPREYWRDRMNKMRLAGLTTLQTYISWNTHEAVEGKYDFTGGRNLTAYLSLAQEMGLYVILRPGPYVCAEWTFGGFPYWLLNKEGIKFRVYNGPYLDALSKWFDVVLPMVEPFLYKNGGPILAVQVENEYGGFGLDVCDKRYLNYLLQLNQKHLGYDTIYYTLDNSNVPKIACGAIAGLLKALDYGVDKNPTGQFALLRRFQEHGPFVNAEYWGGWFDRWGGNHATRGANQTAKVLDQTLALNASLNFYMFHGGTNFGYTNGAMSGSPDSYNVRVTSYDYDSPIDEAGDLTEKFMAVREVYGKYTTLPPDPLPPPSPKWAYPDILLNTKISLFDNIDKFSKCVKRTLPVTMEQLNQAEGFILYQSLWSGKIGNITLLGVHDRAVVYIDRQRIGCVNRMYQVNGSVEIPADFGDHFTKYPDSFTISIFVENLGRINHGRYMNEDFKGIVVGILIDGVSVNSKEWMVCGIPLDRIEPALLTDSSLNVPPDQAPFTPTIFCGTFSTPNRNDTFLDPTGWVKGQAYLNDINLGRYWPSVGPQVTLYTPGVWLKNKNTICLFELETPKENLKVKFTDTANLGKSKDNARPSEPPNLVETETGPANTSVLEDMGNEILIEPISTEVF